MMPPNRAWPEFKEGDVVPGTQYVVAELVGRGGQAEVYLVHHAYIEKARIMKLWCAPNMSDESFRAFRREAVKQGDMAHENIVSVIEGGMTEEKERRPYFVMERLKGKTLDQALRQMRAKESLLKDEHLDRVSKGLPSSYRPAWLSIRSAGGLCIQICAALTHAHVQHGILHRDVKTANIFLVDHGFNRVVPKLLDFGIFKPIEEALANPDGLFWGSLTHCGPEQLKGLALPQSDLYALTGVFYELLTGVRCFPEARSVPELLRAVIHTMPLPPSQRMENVSPRLDAFVMKNLSKDPEKRSPSAVAYAKELAEIIEEYARQEETGGPQDGPTDRMPLNDLMEMSRSESEDSLMRAKEKSFWDSQRGVTVTVGETSDEGRDPASGDDSGNDEGADTPREGEGEARDAGPRIFYAKPVDTDRAPPPVLSRPMPEPEAAGPLAPPPVGNRSAITSPLGSDSVAGFVQSVQREAEQRRIAEEAARLATPPLRVRLDPPAAATPKLGDTDPSRVEPLVPPTNAPRSAVPTSVPIVNMGTPSNSPAGPPISAPPPTGHMTPESHQRAAHQGRVAPQLSTSTLPMGGAPGRVPAASYSPPPPVAGDAARGRAYAQATTTGTPVVGGRVEPKRAYGTVVAGGFIATFVIVAWYVLWLGGPAPARVVEATTLPVPVTTPSAPPTLTEPSALPSPVPSASSAAGQAPSATSAEPKPPATPRASATPRVPPSPSLPRAKPSGPQPLLPAKGPTPKPRRGESPPVGP